MNTGLFFVRFLLLILCVWFVGFGQCVASDEECCLCGCAEEESFGEVNDRFLQGYLQALVDWHYYEGGVGVKVENGHVYLSTLPCNALLADSIVTLVGDHPCVKSVQVVDCCPEGCCCTSCRCTPSCPDCIWLPQNTVLFAPLVADPRQVSYSAGYRIYGRGTMEHAVGITFGDLFPLVRWRRVGPWCGDLQLDVEAGCFAVFEAGRYSFPLRNNDYYLSIPLSYAVERCSFRLRFWHLSSHLGDEYMENNPDVKRLNVSRDGVDFFASYQLSREVRLYGGIGCVFNEDKDFERERGYLEYGTELRVLCASSCYCHLYGTPFLAMHFRHWKDPVHDSYDNNRSYAVGYEWSKLSGVGRKVRVFIEYHEGFSVEGQFSRTETEYVAIRLSYGF